MVNHHALLAPKRYSTTYPIKGDGHLLARIPGQMDEGMERIELDCIQAYIPPSWGAMSMLIAHCAQSLRRRPL